MAGGRLPGGGFWDGPDRVNQTVIVKGETVHFDFDERFGPLVTDKAGEPLARQPISERHPFWRPFKVWLVAYRAAKPPAPPPKPGPTDHLDRRPATNPDSSGEEG